MQGDATSAVKFSRRVRVRGLVQGVGFRPTMWRLARQFKLAGDVCNDGDGVLINISGNCADMDNFIAAIESHCPPLARIDAIESECCELPLTDHFSIEPSIRSSANTGIVPDASSCSHCVTEVLDSNNRRYRYPFTNCTHCGPRLSIIDAIPYDRGNTSMAGFPMCETCQAEYLDPDDRRYHAQPNACPQCGPRCWLEPAHQLKSAIDDIDAASQLLKRGSIVAIKGLGGFHLACDASNLAAVARLRERKHRYAKPLAMMARDVEMIQLHCQTSPEEEQLLNSSAAPIVLLQKHARNTLASNIAPEQNLLGFMLPYTPLHHLLMSHMERPLVLTSANRSTQPQCIHNEDARQQLKSIADYWLMHDRDIYNRLDDSLVRINQTRPEVLRRARGYAPTGTPLPRGFETTPDILAFGAELKNSFCLIRSGQAILSQHMGDLENPATFADYTHNLTLYQQLFEHHPAALVIDAHPEYLSSKHGRQQAEATAIRMIEVQHHHAHIAACLADNNWPMTAGKVLGIALDGLGYGDDGMLWGGEFLLCNYAGYKRLAHLQPVALPGGGQAMREPWRNTYAHLTQALTAAEQQRYAGLPLFEFLHDKPCRTLDAMIAGNFNSPPASSCGRLFDAVAAALGICREHVSYEAQAAMELEALVNTSLLRIEQARGYTFAIIEHPHTGLLCLDARSLWLDLLGDLQHDTRPEVIATRFHIGLANGITDIVLQLQENQVLFTHVALSGGVFQNRTLFNLVEQRLAATGFTVLCHSQSPANDGGIALGQAMIAATQLITETSDDAIPATTGSHFTASTEKTWMGMSSHQERDLCV